LQWKNYWLIEFIWVWNITLIDRRWFIHHGGILESFLIKQGGHTTSVQVLPVMDISLLQYLLHGANDYIFNDFGSSSPPRVAWNLKCGASNLKCIVIKIQ
jgi:hypothetical protein